MLVGRVIPVVRSFISVPAGMAEMNRVRFAVLTTIGSAVWVALLAGLGYAAGSNWKHVGHDFHVAEYPIIALIVVVLAWLLAPCAHGAAPQRRLGLHRGAHRAAWPSARTPYQACSTSGRPDDERRADHADDRLAVEHLLAVGAVKLPSRPWWGRS